MINRDENGVPVSADKISDVTSALKEIEKKMEFTVKKGNSMTQEEQAEVVEKMKDLEPLMALVNADAQKSANPMELIGFLKQVVKIKTLADKIKGMQND